MATCAGCGAQKWHRDDLCINGDCPLLEDRKTVMGHPHPFHPNAQYQRGWQHYWPMGDFFRVKQHRPGESDTEEG